jgi:hypothetical protein
MSDASQGPGWWIASDGKWYPPQPIAAPPPVVAPVVQPTVAPPPAAAQPQYAQPQYAAAQTVAATFTSPVSGMSAASRASLVPLGALVGVVGALLLLLGALLPWLSYHSITVAGIRGNGILTLAIGIGVIGLAACLFVARKSHIVATTLAIAMTTAAATAFVISGLNVMDIGRQMSGGLLGGTSTGIGLWITLVASIVCGLGGLVCVVGAMSAGHDSHT